MKRGLKLIILGGFLLLTTPIRAQDFQNGIYFIDKVEKEEECQDPIKPMYADSVYCLTGQPIIASLDFKFVSEIKKEAILGGRYFVISLSQSSMGTLAVIEAKALAENMGLVINDRLVGKLNVSEVAEVGVIRVGEGIMHSQLKKFRSALYRQLEQGNQLK